MVVTASERITHESYQFDCRAVIVPLVSSTGHGHASIKRIHYQDGKFALGSILCAVVPKNENQLNPLFLHVYLSYFKDQLLVPLMKGSANVSLSIGTLSDLKIIVPPMDVQQRVVALAQNHPMIKSLEEEIDRQQSLLELLKNSILQDAIKGNLSASWRNGNSDTPTTQSLLSQIQREKEVLLQDKRLRAERPFPKVNPDEIPFNIPKTWSWCRIADATLLIVDCPHSTPKWTSTGRTCVKTGQFQRFHLDLTNRFFVSETTYEQRVDRLVPLANDVLYSREGSILGIACRIPMGEEICLGQRMMLLRSNSPTTSAYLEILLNSPHVTKIATKATLGGCAPHINVGEIKAFPIPLPPLAEQAVILEKVEMLNKISIEVENYVQCCRSQAAQLLQAVLKEAFTSAS
jgi:type I restriction enzyme S subunit